MWERESLGKRIRERRTEKERETARQIQRGRFKESDRYLKRRRERKELRNKEIENDIWDLRFRESDK